MAQGRIRIGVVAPAGRLDEALAERLIRFAAGNFPEVELTIHPQCFLAHGHFAGPDAVRAAAFLDIANDAAFDALWWARGGYGSGRIVPLVLPHLGEAAKTKTYLGYSDAGFLLGALYRAGFAHLVHGPVVRDLARAGGEAAIARALGFLSRRDATTLEPSLASGMRHAAFNLTVLSHMIGTDLMPDLDGHVLMVEEVSEHLYRLDRAFFHIAAAPALRGLKGIRLGRVSEIPENDVPFGENEEQIARHWCEVANIPWLGRADIGHDAENKIVPFGAWPWG